MDLTMDQLQFLFKIDTIEASDEWPEDHAGDMNWKPPLSRHAFRSISTTNWWRWKASGISSAEPHTGYYDHRTCSLFYNNESSQFLAVPFDCRAFSVNDADIPRWSRLMFRHGSHSYGGIPRPLSTITFQEESHVLATWKAPYWMPQLLPTSYRGHDYDPKYDGQQASSLTGDLSLIIALAAFSAPQEYMTQIIDFCFKPPYWRHHDLADNRQHMRGMVVSIGPDPNTAITSEVLRRFEEGDYGPIIV